MSFLQSLVTNVSQYFGDSNSVNTAYSVKKVSPTDYAKATLVEGADESGYFKLYRTVKPEGYECVLLLGTLGGKTYSLFRLTDGTEAGNLHKILTAKLTPIVAHLGSALDKAQLQKLCDGSRSHQGWTAAHLSAHASLQDAFRNNLIVRELNEPCPESLVTPLHVAIQAESVEVVRLLLAFSHTRLDIADVNGDTVFHYAARIENPLLMELLCRTKTPIINQANDKQENPLHLAIALGRQDLVQALLAGGADSGIPGPEGTFPIHIAIKNNNLECVKAVLSRDLRQLKAKDGKHGAAPLHWASSKQIVNFLLEHGADFASFSETTETPLHVFTRKNRLECALALLARRPEAVHQRGPDGNTPLHLAVTVESLELTRTMIVFGADINKTNDKGETPRHLAASLKKSALGEALVYTLHAVGASRCNASMTFCTESCHHAKTANGSPPTDGPQCAQLAEDPAYDAHISAAAVKQLRDGLKEESRSSNGDVAEEKDRLLCLDGGGIRGLVLIQLLQALQDRACRPIRDCFDWIVGTSTGGILALAILIGKSPVEALGLYLRFKDEVFVGSKPYNAEKLERFLANEFGEATTMTTFKKPRVIVTAVLGDRKPAELHLFRNYDAPVLPGEKTIHVLLPHDKSSDGGELVQSVKKRLKLNNYGATPTAEPFQAPPLPEHTLLWKAARSSGAAPTFFRSMGRFLDGGLMANNPTLDALTEIHKFNMAQALAGKGSSTRRLGTVVSFGTGRPPIVPVKTVDVFMPESMFSLETAKAVLGAKNLGTLLVEQATAADGQPVERSRAWLSSMGVPFYRLSPRLSEDIPLDATDDKLLVKMMWETKAYIHANDATLRDLALLLTRDPATLCY